MLLYAAAGLQTVQAGPWTQADGVTYARLELSRVELEGLHGWRSDAYGERGLNENWTLTLKGEGMRYDTAADFNTEAYRVTLRRELYAYDRFLISGETGLVYSSASGVIGGCRGMGGEAGLSLGMSGVFRQLNWYAAVDGAYRSYENGCQTEKLDLVFGSEVTRGWYIISKLFVEQGSFSRDSVKTQTALLARFGPTDISLAYSEEIGGRFSETGLHISLARRF